METQSNNTFAITHNTSAATNTIYTNPWSIRSKNKIIIKHNDATINKQMESIPTRQETIKKTNKYLTELQRTTQT